MVGTSRSAGPGRFAAKSQRRSHSALPMNWRDAQLADMARGNPSTNRPLFFGVFYALNFRSPAVPERSHIDKDRVADETDLVRCGATGRGGDGVLAVRPPQRKFRHAVIQEALGTRAEAGHSPRPTRQGILVVRVRPRGRRGSRNA